MKSLQRMKNVIMKNDTDAKIYPGHGEMIENGVERVQYYINHRLERERQIMECLRKFQNIYQIESIDHTALLFFFYLFEKKTSKVKRA